MKKQKILDKCEAMTLLCSKAANHWSFVKFCFTIPLVLTSSAMLIINSISQDANTIKIPNIVVNGISVLIVSLNNNIRASEKFEVFKKLSQQFMILSQEVEAIEGEITPEQYSIIILKYDNLIAGCMFEEIPQRMKTLVNKLYTDNNRFIPIQLNGVSGLFSKDKRDSKPNITEIV